MRLLKVILSLLLCPSGAFGYCWQAGWNPYFTGAPTVTQIDMRTVEVREDHQENHVAPKRVPLKISWKDIAKSVECADQFLVKYWRATAPTDYRTTRLIETSVFSTNIKGYAIRL